MNKKELKGDVDFANRLVLRTVIIWAVFIFSLMIFFTFIYHGLSPLWRSLETRGTEAGYAAVSSKKELLLKLHQDWTKLETQRVAASKNDPELAQTYAAQQVAVVNRMRIEAATLPGGQVPPEVQGLIH